MRLAIYGKGGIGKSTVSANLTAALAREGYRVLQIGCDPKHDSTRLLLKGNEPPTVTSLIRDQKRDELSLQDIVSIGYGGSLCVEAGGPEPGVGCAGRGILSTFELLGDLGIESLGADVTIYDVLGDVVCGGFAVPLRDDYAEKVLIVSSGEFMSIYAANNILRGVRNYDPMRMAGIIFNSRGAEEERSRIHRFADAVGLPIVSEIPRSSRFLEAEERGMTLVESDPDSDLAAIFYSLAKTVLEETVCEALPLSDERLEEVVLGKRTKNRPQRRQLGNALKGSRPLRPPVYTSRNVERKEILHGCAFTGAVVTCASVEGLNTVVHAPDSCAHLSWQMVANAARRAFIREGVVIQSFLRSALMGTSMKETTMVFGGKEVLENTLRQALKDSDTLALISSCPSGIIGEDLEAVARKVSVSYSDSKMIVIAEDGNVGGDHMQGVIDACIALGDALIIPDLEPEDDKINIVGIKPIAANNEQNITYVSSVLDALGMSLNCRFIGGTSVESIRGFNRGRYSILANTDRFALMLAEYLQSEKGAQVLNNALKPGMIGTESWLRELASLTGRTAEVEQLIRKLQDQYEAEVQRISKELRGYRICVVSFHKDIDWLIDTLDDLGMEIEDVVVVDRPDNLMDYHVLNRHTDRMTFLESYEPNDLIERVVSFSPDILLSTYPMDVPGRIVQERIPLVPDVGHLAPLNLARKWILALKAPRYEGWRRDHD